MCSGLWQDTSRGHGIHNTQWRRNRFNAAGNRHRGMAPVPYDADNDTALNSMHFEYVDSPDTTGSVEYEVRIRYGGARITYFNRARSGADTANHKRDTSRMILQEV